jgi:fatty-acyl-CoA synthase
MGEIGRYYIIPKENTQPTKEEIIAYCKEYIANYKIPKQIIFRNELPLTPAGKIMKSRLKEEFEETGN